MTPSLREAGVNGKGRMSKARKVMTIVRLHRTIAASGVSP
jgi:hypothetical protein